MSGSNRSSIDLDSRRRKVLFRSWHRGTREMDLVLGRFADAEIDKLTDDELTIYEHLIDAPDRQLFSWLTGTEETPEEYDTDIFARIRDFYTLPEEKLS
ncbi:succinate dehydrogenase assembly factor 2 [Aureimonas fodinaquatilis]|uniref:FAD assembly factor SdhE n=1 Tax=Aureimonas fodinaquatilis TaxID=2565783 RepID=A0A5B0DVK6_9HYPH|nr:succinate dehydrogenase assembly factor 2 [Aureimonas fodinaquatilis]KAA0970443.1 succinate dehydrogenase assembly factor 2 [Aureimonas fodinaquatilis]